MKKENVAWLFTVIVLSILLILSIILGVTGYYSSVNFLHSNSDLQIGDSASVAVRPNETSVISYTFDGSFLPNETLPHVIQISNTNSSSDLRVRVKAVVFGLTRVVPFEFVTTEHFEQAVDGYYYYDELLKSGNKITFSNYITIPADNEFESGEKYILTVIVETLDSKCDNIWEQTVI